MESDEDDFFASQPSASGLTLSHMNNKSSVLCPETQDITSQYLALQQLDAHQKMVSRAKGCVDTMPPKSMQSFISVSTLRKKKLLRQKNNESQINFENGDTTKERRPVSSRLAVYNSEEDEVESTNASYLHKGIQTGIPMSNFTCKTAEKISWYLEALSLGELQSQYFAFMDGSSSTSRDFRPRNSPSTRGKKRIVKGDIMDWHREHFVEPRKQFSPRILAGINAKSKVKEMRCYNPPFRRKKISNSHSSDTFESYDEEDNEEELSQIHQNPGRSDHSSFEADSGVSKRQVETDTPYNRSIHMLPHYRRDYSNYSNHSVLSKNEEDRYLDFLSKVTEDILRSGVYSDKAIQQAFEFHLQFYKDDANKEKLQSLLDQVLDGLKITDEGSVTNQNFLFPHSRPSTPPEKETSSSGFSSDALKIPAELNSSIASELASNLNELNLDNS